MENEIVFIESYEIKIAWLAGLWDGEGSIGIIRNHNKRDNYTGYRTVVQMSMTDGNTIEEAKRILEIVGVTAYSHTFQERDPSKHKDAHYLKINRADSIRQMAKYMLRYSVTKRRQWELIYEFTTSRLDGVELDELGRIKRGGDSKNRRKYSEREMEISEEIRKLNQRGVKYAERNRETTIEPD